VNVKQNKSTGKAPRLDMITNEQIQFAGTVLVSKLSELFNAM